MANGRRNGRGRRGRGNSGLYARPIVEPCNFVEIDVHAQSSESITYGDIITAFTGLVSLTNVGKMRITSIVLDQPVVVPASNQAGGSVTQMDVYMGLSGNHYSWSNLQKPLKIRFGKDLGDDGQWVVLDGTAVTANAFPGNFVATDPFITLEHAGAEATSDLHVRIAFTDTGDL